MIATAVSSRDSSADTDHGVTESIMPKSTSKDEVQNTSYSKAGTDSSIFDTSQTVLYPSDERIVYQNGFSKQPLPQEIIEKTAEKYRECYSRITGKEI